MSQDENRYIVVTVTTPIGVKESHLIIGSTSGIIIDGPHAGVKTKDRARDLFYQLAVKYIPEWASRGEYKEVDWRNCQAVYEPSDHRSVRIMVCVYFPFVDNLPKEAIP